MPKVWQCNVVSQLPSMQEFKDKLKEAAIAPAR